MKILQTLMLGELNIANFNAWVVTQEELRTL